MRARTKPARAIFFVKPFSMDELAASVTRVSGMHIAAEPRSHIGTGQLRNHRDLHLQQLAVTYVKERRTDRAAVDVLEELAANPYCEARWLTSLALLYVLHKEWGKLAHLAGRLDRLATEEA